ncbi:MAG TPA: hypothetical protein VNX21_02930, partial [Candidatus Thermoplasmatota archaeon]|nr:hypothetical protein [Candidatus Thermoplasmatota archaeon]
FHILLFLQNAEAAMRPWIEARRLHPPTLSPLRIPVSGPAQRFLDSIHDHAGEPLTDFRTAIVVGTQYRWRRLAELGEWDGPLGHVGLVEVPATTLDRLGSYPLMAGCVAEFIIKRTPRLVGDLVDFLSKDDLPKVLRPFRIPEQVTPQVGANVATVASDLVASAICGPSYLYALARFGLPFLPSSGAVGGSTDHHDYYARQIARLHFCASVLVTMDLEFRFASRALDLTSVRLPASLVMSVGSSISAPYTDRLHALAIEKVQPALIRGELFQAEPRVVLNALWDAVSGKKGYANEMSAAHALAAYRSRQDWSIPYMGEGLVVRPYMESLRASGRVTAEAADVHPIRRAARGLDP